MLPLQSPNAFARHGAPARLRSPAVPHPPVSSPPASPSWWLVASAMFPSTANPNPKWRVQVQAGDEGRDAEDRTDGALPKTDQPWAIQRRRRSRNLRKGGTQVAATRMSRRSLHVLWLLLLFLLPSLLGLRFQRRRGGRRAAPPSKRRRAAAPSASSRCCHSHRSCSLPTLPAPVKRGKGEGREGERQARTQGQRTTRPLEPTHTDAKPQTNDETPFGVPPPLMARVLCSASFLWRLPFPSFELAAAVPARPVAALLPARWSFGAPFPPLRTGRKERQDAVRFSPLFSLFGRVMQLADASPSSRSGSSSPFPSLRFAFLRRASFRAAAHRRTQADGRAKLKMGGSA
jgi:hypothetical protein